MLQKEQWMQIHVLKAQGVSEGARDHAAPGHFSPHGGRGTCRPRKCRATNRVNRDQPGSERSRRTSGV
ncbi:hypothetical protein AQ824_22875 [Burkholderia pseudomallei]|nr:hypothetical protein AQ748_06750 [Burkholderia pseudomallei]OMU92587.1 hypothetical protein AQ784_18710 [Burkholderia pseudomallei]OMU98403.1 hypothetical protein AQ785_15555 [Burkholderia pseudomallei]OMW53836.1 hypothetical protein AQ812_22400 [Burkholderia pseudomallei]OMW73478.1 hypothetical protein AQ814_16070 [Burkholderia pseudomallei]